MDGDTIIKLTYAGVALVVAIISATIMRAKLVDLEVFNIGIALIGAVSGMLWPLTIVVWVVYLASDFLYSKFFKAKEN